MDMFILGLITVLSCVGLLIFTLVVRPKKLMTTRPPLGKVCKHCGGVSWISEDGDEWVCYTCGASFEEGETDDE